MTDAERKRSIERAKAGATTLAAMGLNVLLPGSGTLTVRLGEHIAGIVTDARLARLEDFHNRVFAGDQVTDDEINQRFQAMKDEDFGHLLVAMLTDIEREKLPLYANIYIHLVDASGKTSRDMKRRWITAVSQLHLADYGILKQVIDGKARELFGDGGQRLLIVGAMSVRTGAGMGLMVEATQFGRDLYARVEPALAQARAGA